MSRTRQELWLSVVLVAAPALVHSLYQGSYVVEPNGAHGTFWVGPIGTMLPFVLLACVFLAHCQRYRQGLPASSPATFPRSAYWGASLAWLSMMGLTLFLTSQPLGPATSSTMGIAVLLTPLCYLPLMLGSYLLGTIAARSPGSGTWASKNTGSR